VNDKPRPARRIGELLIEAGLIDQRNLDQALKIQSERGGKIVEILISLGYIDAAIFLRFLSNESRIPSIQLANYEIPKEIIALIPREIAVTQQVFPIDKMSRLLTVGMACPLDSQTIAMLENQTGLKIKPVLCSAEDIHAAIKRYYPTAPEKESEPESVAEYEQELESTLRLTGVAALIRSIETLPALSKTVHEVREAMQNPAMSAKNIAQIIGQDPGIAAKVLSVANSAAYSFSKKLDDISLAVALIGLSEVYGIVMASSVMDVFKEKNSFDFKAFWKHSLCTAAAARMLAQHAQVSDMGTVFSAGLLHDIGQLALAKIAPTLYEKIDLSLNDLDLIAQEEKVMSVAHTEAGYELASHWNLPPVIAESIRYHHHPERCQEEYKPVVAIAALASKMAHIAGDPNYQENDPIPDSLRPPMEQLNLDDETAHMVLGWLQTFIQSGLEI